MTAAGTASKTGPQGTDPTSPCDGVSSLRFRTATARTQCTVLTMTSLLSMVHSLPRMRELKTTVISLSLSLSLFLYFSIIYFLLKYMYVCSSSRCDLVHASDIAPSCPHKCLPCRCRVCAVQVAVCARSESKSSARVCGLHCARKHTGQPPTRRCSAWAQGKNNGLVSPSLLDMK